MVKGKAKALFCIIFIIIFIAIGSFISFLKFNTINPFGSLNGFAKVVFTDTEYVKIQEHPKVIIANTNASLYDYMEKQGYKKDEEKQMGSLNVFNKGDFEEIIEYSKNKYFALWSWKE